MDSNRLRIHAGCWVDVDQQGIWRQRHLHPLPYRTWLIVDCLMHHANHLVAQDVLYQVGWGERRNVWDLQDHIHRIRGLIEPVPHRPRWLITRRHVGYMLRVAAPSSPATRLRTRPHL